ncbi:MAG: hypothetical protein ABIH34_04080, partial [Nanoarchaeota archaeon]
MKNILIYSIILVLLTSTAFGIYELWGDIVHDTNDMMLAESNFGIIGSPFAPSLEWPQGIGDE